MDNEWLKKIFHPNVWSLIKRCHNNYFASILMQYLCINSNITGPCPDLYRSIYKECGFGE